MIQIIGPPLSQWDTGRSMEASGSTATHAHFANRGDSYAVIMELVDGKTKIPDYLLQTNKDLFIYLVRDGVTQESKTFSVRKREKPENYVYEDDRRNYIYELIDNAEEATRLANEATEKANKAVENLKNAKGEFVKSVNGVKPDANGNVQIPTGGGGILNSVVLADQDTNEIFVLSVRSGELTMELMEE